MRRGTLRCLGVIVAMLVSASVPGGETVDPVLDGSRDVLVRRVFIPSPKRVHGELRWVRRAEGNCLQTLLYTTMLRRGVETIRNRELASWPPDSIGYRDSQTYLAMLEASKRQVLETFDRRSDKTDKLQRMLIEYVVTPKDSIVAIYELDLEGSGDDVKILAKRPIAVEHVSKKYAMRAMHIQAVNGFGADFHELDAAIGYTGG